MELRVGVDPLRDVSVGLAGKLRCNRLPVLPPRLVPGCDTIADIYALIHLPDVKGLPRDVRTTGNATLPSLLRFYCSFTRQALAASAED